MSQTNLPYTAKMASNDTAEHDEMGFTPNEAAAS